MYRNHKALICRITTEMEQRALIPITEKRSSKLILGTRQSHVMILEFMSDVTVAYVSYLIKSTFIFNFLSMSFQPLFSTQRPLKFTEYFQRPLKNPNLHNVNHCLNSNYNNLSCFEKLK